MKKISYNAPITLTFALLALGALLLNGLSEGQSNLLFFSTYNSSWLNPLTYIRLFTYVLGHSNWTHYFNNMCYILLLGPMAEEKYGSRLMLRMIAITALVGSLINTVFFPNCRLLGASGVCFMLIVLCSVTSVSRKRVPLTMLLVLGIYLGTEIYNALFLLDNVSQLTHIAGGITGAILGMKYNRKV